MKILGFRSDPSTPRYAIVDGSTTPLTLLNADAESRLRFPADCNGEATQVTWLYREFERIFHIHPDIGRVVIKKGEHGAFLVGEGVRYALPAYPVDQVLDPTGAGDCFAGGFMGYLAAADCVEPATMRRAMLYGTVTASFCVQGFGVEVLEHKRRAQLESRFNELLEFVTL